MKGLSIEGGLYIEGVIYIYIYIFGCFVVYIQGRTQRCSVNLGSAPRGFASEIGNWWATLDEQGHYRSRLDACSYQFSGGFDF